MKKMYAPLNGVAKKHTHNFKTNIFITSPKI